MAFSLFGKKDKPAEFKKRKDGDTLAQRDAGTRASTRSPATLTDAREAARLTAQKIDQIENEMNMGMPPKPGDLPSPVGGPPTLSVRDPQGGRDQESGREPPVTRHTVSARGPVTQVKPPATLTRPPEVAPLEFSANTLPPLDLGTSQMLGPAGVHASMSLEEGGSGVPPVIEEAAILYANKQSAAAEMILLQALKDNNLGISAVQAWLMLFDLYLVMGREAEHDKLATDYATRFKTTKPAWRGAVQTVAASTSLVAQAPRDDRTCVLDANDHANIGAILATLQRTLDAGEPATLDCRRLRSIDGASADAVVQFVNRAEKSGAVLEIAGVERLAAVARKAVEPGRRDESQGAWHLLMLGYRVLDDQQRFDDASIDYCVTYEISPPQWTPMTGHLKIGPEPDPADDIDLQSAGDTVKASAQGSAPPADAFVLKGEIDGTMDRELKDMLDYAGPRNKLVVDCTRLMRLDFVAAGQLLSTISNLHVGGKTIDFYEPNHLVAALMIVMGLHDHAGMKLRQP